MIVKSTQRQGAGAWPLMVSCGGRRHTWPSAVEVKISGFDVVDGSVRIYGRSMAGEPGRGLSGAATMTRYGSPSSAWHRHGGWGCGVGGAGRDLRHVGVGGGASVWRRGGDADLMVTAARSRVASGRSAATWPVLLRGAGVRMDGLVRGWFGPLVCRGRAVTRLAWSGVVQIGLAGGHFEMRRFAVGGLAGCDVVTELSQAGRNMVGRRGIR